MTRVAVFGAADIRMVGLGTLVPAAVPRLLLSGRSARVLVQVGCLGVVAGAPLVPVSDGTALVTAQVMAALIVTLAERALRPGRSATARTLRVWGAGALVSLLAVSWLHGILDMGVARAQLGAVIALLGLAVFGRMGAAYSAAGTQLDAILATLPPPSEPAERSTADRRA